MNRWRISTKKWKLQKRNARIKPIVTEMKNTSVISKLNTAKRKKICELEINQQKLPKPKYKEKNEKQNTNTEHQSWVCIVCKS